MQSTLFLWAAVILVLFLAMPARALVIDLSYVGPGQRFGNSATQFGSEAPGVRDGGGNLHDIIRAAADVWERVIPDPFRLDIDYGWQPLTGSTVGQHTGRGVSIKGGLTRNTASWIAFDRDYGDWYFDSQPQDSSEYARYQESSGNYGGVTVNDERRYTQPRQPAANGLDLFTVALHELGHAVGWTHANLADYLHDTGRSGSIRIAGGLPGAGATASLQSTHFDETGSLLLAPTIYSGRRVLPSVLDIVSVATISRYGAVRSGLDAVAGDLIGSGTLVDVVIGDGSTVRVNLGRVFDLPEPSSAVLMGLWVLVVGRRRG